ncbi:MAG TPA: DNA-binding response regulator [Planctomycetes bacterium]|nr:DNA-binding response regulator [Planctomycetota bacterium]
MSSTDPAARSLADDEIEAVLALARAHSLEELLAKLSHCCVEGLGGDSAAVYVPRRGSLQRASLSPPDAPFPKFSEVSVEQLEELHAGPRRVSGPPWYPLEEVSLWAAALPGRRRPAGLLLIEGLGANQRGVLRLLVGLAGALLENYQVEVRRTQSMELRRPAPGVSELGLIGDSLAMRAVGELLGKLAQVDSSVLLTGETGTGKTLVAEAIHRAGPRADKPFLALNCSAIPEALVESELFGHEAGAFTGAQRLHRGKVELAEGGTLFLDEVAELPAQAQAKLLSFLESRRYSRVGGERELEADVRVLSATNADPEAAVQAKQLREDLFYRLNVFTLELPALRERGRDVILLARSLGDEISLRYDYPPIELGAAAQARLLSYAWPGNVRELRNVMEKAVILSEGGSIPPDLLPTGTETSAGEVAPSRPAGAGVEPAAEEGESFAEAKARLIEAWEIRYLRELLIRTGGNLGRACREGQLDKRNLQRKIKRYGIDLAGIRANSE